MIVNHLIKQSIPRRTIVVSKVMDILIQLIQIQLLLRLISVDSDKTMRKLKISCMGNSICTHIISFTNV